MIDSTISIEHVSDKVWDAIVIGGGPAGSMAAVRLSREGLRVLLVEKSTPPRDKVCGCCLNAVAVNALDEIGLKCGVMALNAVPIASLSLRASSSQAEVPLTGGLAVSRATLDSELITHAIRSGSEFLSGAKATVEDLNADGSRSIVLEQNDVKTKARAKCILVADGLNGHSLDKLHSLEAKSVKNSRIGAGVRTREFPRNLFREGVIYMTCGSGGYVGMVLLEDGSLDIAAAFDKRFVRSHKNVGTAANTVIHGTNLSEFDLSVFDWQGTPALTRRRKKFSAPALFVIGDAASYAEPFTGEGMAWAFQSANEVVPFVHATLRRNKNSFDHTDWDRAHSKLLSAKQHRSMMLARFLRHPKIVSGVLRVLNNFPFLVHPFLHSVNGASKTSVSTCPHNHLSHAGILDTIDELAPSAGLRR